MKRYKGRPQKSKGLACTVWWDIANLHRYQWI